MDNAGIIQFGCFLRSGVYASVMETGEEARYWISGGWIVIAGGSGRKMSNKERVRRLYE